MKEDGHMVAWHAQPAGETPQDPSRKDVKITYQHVWRVCFFCFFFWSRGSVSKQESFSAQVASSVLLLVLILKASFLSAKWHANGPPFPLLQTSITAVCWKHLCLRGCCWWTFISCAERAGTNHAFGFTSNPVRSTFHTEFLDLNLD